MLGIQLSSEDYFAEVVRVMNHLEHSQLRTLSDLLYKIWEENRQCFIIGNGGSGTSASHFAEDLAKGTIPDEDLIVGTQKRIKVMSLTDNVGWIMAIGNDLSYEEIFVQQLMNLADEGDLLIALSGSGNSPNVLRAVRWANEHGLTSFGLTGYDGGMLKQIQAEGIHIAIDDMGVVESMHLTVFHWILNDLHARINLRGRYQKTS